jgi:PAS domain S-box-containing protein
MVRREEIDNMQQLAHAIRDNFDLLVDRYDTGLRRTPGYDRLPETLWHDLERDVLSLIIQCLERADYSTLVQYVQQLANQWVTDDDQLAWLQTALMFPENLLTPLIHSVEASNFLWQALNRSQSVVWQLVTERAYQTEKRFRTIVETSRNGVLITDDAFRLIYANDELAQISGYAREELLGIDFRQLLDEDGRKAVADRYLRRQSGEDVPPRHETAFLRKDGVKRDVEMIAVALEDLNGRPYTVAQVSDVTERKRLELQIRESLERRSIQVQTSTEVAQHVAAAPEIGELFHRVVTLVKERFNYYHAQLFRYVPAEDAVELITGYGEIGQKMLTAGHKLAMGRGVVGTAAATGQSILAADVTRDLDWRPNPNLPDTKGELAVPIKLGSGDAESQALALKHFATGSYDGIAVAAIDPEAIAHITCESIRRGKPIVAITTDLGQDNQTALVFAVEHELGHLLGVQAGMWAKQHLPDSRTVKIGVLTYRALSNVVERERGIIDGIQAIIGERASVVVSASALEQKEATYLAEGWLHDYPDLNMIVAYNDATALGAYQAAQNAGWHDPDQFFIGGIDAVPEALNAIQQGGVYQATVNQPPEVMGFMAVRTLIAAIKGIPVKPVHALYCAPVNRSNAAEFSGPSREATVLAHQDIIPVEALSGLDVSGLRLGLSVLTLANPFFATLAASAQKEAQRLGVQLVVNDPSRVLGVLDVQSDQANTLTDDDRLLLEGLCGQIASAMESTRLLEQLRQDEAQLSEALKIAKLGYWEYDVEKDLFHFNDQFYSIFHTTAEQAGGYQISSAQYAQQFVHPDDLSMVGGEIERALNSTDRHYNRQLEHRILYTDGGVGYISVSVNIDRDEQGRILRYYGANQDITQQKLAEEALRRNEAQLSEALKIAKLGYWEYDVEKDLFLFNDQFYSIFHTTAEQAGGYQLSSAQYAQQFVHPDDLPIVGAEIEKALNSTDRHYNRQLEHRIRYADGGVGYISVNINIDRDEQGKILRYYGANQDITERKQIEEALAQEQSLMRALMDSVTDHIYFKDSQSRFLRISRSQANRFGLSDPLQAAGKTDFDFFTEEHARPAYEDEQEIIRTGQSLTKEERETWTNRSDTWVLTTKFPLRNEAGQIIGTFGRSVDITDRKQVEAERERLLADQQKRALQLQTAAEVSRAASSILNLDELLPQAVELIRTRFDLYYAGIFLLSELGDWAVLRAGTGEAGQAMLVNGHKLKIGGQSMISQCIVTQRARIALDVGEEAVRFDNPLLPLTRSEMALPLVSRGRVIGAVTIQSEQPAAFSHDDVTVLQSMADQIGTAVENARLYEQAQTALREVDAINRRLTGEAWDAYLRQQALRDVIWLADDESAAPEPLPQLDEQLTAGEITVEPDPEDELEATVTAPILLRGQPIGALRMRTPMNEWGDDTEAMLADITSHIAQAVENARLVEQTQRTAQRERMINEINARVRRSMDLDAILRTAVNELGQSLKAARVVARVGTTTAEDAAAPAGDGRGKIND